MINIIKGFLIVFGLMFFIPGLMLFHETYVFSIKATRTTGMVINNHREVTTDDNTESITYAPVFKVNIPGRKKPLVYQSSSSSSIPHEIGSKIAVSYLPNNPEKVEIVPPFSQWIASFAFTTIGLLIFLVGVLSIIRSITQKRKDHYLKEHGEALTTDYECIETNKSLSINGIHPSQIISHWQDPKTQKFYRFHSENIMFNPEPYIQNKQLTVYRNPKKPKEYWMDISFLPDK